MKVVKLEEIYQPIENDLRFVEEVLQNRIQSINSEAISKISDSPLVNGGRRLRPALVLLFARASQQPNGQNKKLINIAAAMELIHMASLVHDDVIDHSKLRRNSPTINHLNGDDVAIAFGDYLFSAAFELISTCGNGNILRHISSATKAMCEGELLQVCERENLNLLREHYFLIVEKKTAALFISSCQVGGVIVNSSKRLQSAFQNYGLNFGIAFQVVDDCLDLISDRNRIGKFPGSDLRMGELTLPILNLLGQSEKKDMILDLIESRDKEKAFKKIKQEFLISPAFKQTKQDVSSYISKAKDGLEIVADSPFKNSLYNLATYVEEKLKS